jgi:hypothetical protein
MSFVNGASSSGGGSDIRRRRRRMKLMHFQPLSTQSIFFPDCGTEKRK